LIGIDTNVLVRYIMQDDVSQAELAGRFFNSLDTSDPGFISLVTLAELGWVLGRSFKLKRLKIVHAQEKLLNSEQLMVELDPLVREALELFQQGNADFADCLIAKCSEAAGCDSVVTFDRKAAKSLRMKLLS
jgi:predicted nucleic-acid-binding protein